jgi:hypothetical protein
MRLALAAGIVTRLVRVRTNRRDNNPATRTAGVAGIVTRLARVRINRRDNRSRRCDLGRPTRGVAESGPPRDKETRASAIALRGEGDLGKSENARWVARIQLETRKRPGTRQARRIFPMSAFGTKQTSRG